MRSNVTEWGVLDVLKGPCESSKADKADKELPHEFGEAHLYLV